MAPAAVDTPAAPTRSESPRRERYWCNRGYTRSGRMAGSTLVPTTSTDLTNERQGYLSGVTRDWGEWHRKYDDPTSGHPQRLAVVVEQIRAALDRADPGAIRVLSLCSGDGRDIATAATGHHRAADLTGCLVELDDELAAAAREHLAPLGSRLDVRAADAGDPDVWADVVPVDLLLLCGIFGNVPDDDVERTVLASSAVGRPGAAVIWTRHRRPPDLTPAVRQWFMAAGCTSLGFWSGGPGGFGVGAELLEGATGPLDRSTRLFAFTNG